jgi:hypothetical protein
MSTKLIDLLKELILRSIIYKISTLTGIAEYYSERVEILKYERNFILNIAPDVNK